MSQYLVLIYADENAVGQAGPQLWNQLHSDHREFGTTNAAAIAGGNALQSSDTATSIRGDGADGFVVTDGPFLETKEVLGGYYLIEAADLDAAIAVAKQVPAPHGGVEVRPVQVLPDM
jgi:hypothetical protein